MDQVRSRTYSEEQAFKKSKRQRFVVGLVIFVTLLGALVSNVLFYLYGKEASKHADSCVVVPDTPFNVVTRMLNSYLADLTKLGIAMLSSSVFIVFAFLFSPEVRLWGWSFGEGEVATLAKYIVIFLAYMLHCWTAGAIFFGQFKHMSSLLKSNLPTNAACLRTRGDMSDMLSTVTATFVIYTVVGVFAMTYTISSRRDLGSGRVVRISNEPPPEKYMKAYNAL